MLLKIGFDTAEWVLFVVPALPSQLKVRLGIISVYFVMYCFKVQYVYARFKKECLKPEKVKYYVEHHLEDTVYVDIE